MGSVCWWCGYSGSLQRLIAANADYVVDGMCRQLRQVKNPLAVGAAGDNEQASTPDQHCCICSDPAAGCLPQGAAAVHGAAAAGGRGAAAAAPASGACTKCNTGALLTVGFPKLLGYPTQLIARLMTLPCLPLHQSWVHVKDLHTQRHAENILHPGVREKQGRGEERRNYGGRGLVSMVC